MPGVLSLPSADLLRPEAVDAAAYGKMVVAVAGVLLPGPLGDEKLSAYRRFKRRGWCIFAGQTALAAGLYAWWCLAARRPLVAIERMDGGWVVSLDAAHARRRLSEEAQAAFRRLAGRAGASGVETSPALCLARLDGFADAASLAETVAQTFVRLKPVQVMAAAEEVTAR
ncbi:MAG: hypothetical protein IMX02_06255 [Limnochordaceae bacterium]|nr:hypothetical protein [Limnochordaceae bacterium]